MPGGSLLVKVLAVFAPRHHTFLPAVWLRRRQQIWWVCARMAGTSETVASMGLADFALALQTASALSCPLVPMHRTPQTTYRFSTCAGCRSHPRALHEHLNGRICPPAGCALEHDRRPCRHRLDCTTWPSTCRLVAALWAIGLAPGGPRVRRQRSVRGCSCGSRMGSLLPVWTWVRQTQVAMCKAASAARGAWHAAGRAQDLAAGVTPPCSTRADAAGATVRYTPQRWHGARQGYGPGAHRSRGRARWRVTAAGESDRLHSRAGAPPCISGGG